MQGLVLPQRGELEASRLLFSYRNWAASLVRTRGSYFLQRNYSVHRYIDDVPHLDLAHKQGCLDRDEILPRFLGSHLRVLG